MLEKVSGSCQKIIQNKVKKSEAELNIIIWLNFDKDQFLICTLTFPQENPCKFHNS